VFNLHATAGGGRVMTDAEVRPRLSVPVSAEHDQIRGPVEAPVTLLEYGDYECPDCGAMYPVIKEILNRLVGRVRFVFRNFPLRSAHPYAQEAAEAAEAAAGQDRFWEMHDRLFEHQEELDLPYLRRYARELGLELKQFDYDLASNIYAQKVQDDFTGGVRSGVNGTPTFFINGKRYSGRHDFNSLLAALELANPRLE
jgi:protein-disulfide isomerase